ncbi:monovalent cation/H+ antiporter subunit A [Pusillimonas noertemannii]|uniref:Multisubunit potassium/proton antiporter PhaA subunit /multisubunit potassium/proton antiporter PhaB subunit n=1 Tax=Pusillimonas noertemannii TaxID=305977 RepID=A0A2U1CJ66_9BURK|nr:monovalent cation/H+ antiporter subunit A [Pusillimonas noertemannii]NYT70082.1 monovalent cation/H+ antiporter subunit A [Pusillimonas noertemannii]PVY61028.1 multisubunit potassium/proton antiporter PhaA subunit /multisubunit potassium/proton antiporter PhaB subunit [Pusillimonas noertemannii]TFL08319.1 monovalent cation/H+ antiporter subunit A [Pusillimonas noertemannii]
MSLILILILPFIGSLIAVALPSNARNIEAWLSGAIALACAVLTALHYPAIAEGQVVQFSTPWIPGGLPIDFNLRMDGYAWLFGMLITLMGALIVLYARYYLSPQDPVPRFFSFFLLFMGSMLGVVMSGNLVQLVVFWELTSLTSFMLIAYWNHRLDARRGARMSLTVTGAGGLCLLAGVLMLGHVVGSYDLDIVLASGDMVRQHPWYTTILVLIALGALTKSAQFPFHFWLPNAMAAPTPVSAYLHSATMVKAGVFLLARFWPVLAGTDEWFYIIGGAGLCTLVLGAYAAIFQQDMKGVLAYSTISHLGLITLLLGLNSRLGLVAAIFHMMNHATFKASLFMAAGIVDHETGTRDMGRLSGLRKAMPITATLAVVAAASMAGVPLLNGFLSKEMFFAETVLASHGPVIESGLPLMAVVASAFSVAYSLRFVLEVFYGPKATDLPRSPHEPPFWMLVPSGLLVLTCLVVGMLPMYTLGPLLESATFSILGDATPHYDLKIWHGFNLPLAMSLTALAGGILLMHLLRHQNYVKPGRAPLIYRFDGRRSFELLMEGIDSLSATLLNLLYSPGLQRQLLVITAGTFVVALLPLMRGGWLQPELGTEANLFFITLWLAGSACAIGAARQAKFHRLATLALSGGAGLATALTFAWFSAPDLALTQLAVEVVTVVLILLGLRWLPPRIEADDGSAPLNARTVVRRGRDLAVAVAAGAGMAALAYAVMTRPSGQGISDFFLLNALPEGHGSNVVNVILVDFRGFDTLGEITVLGIVALTVFALMRRFRPPPESIKDGPLRRQQGANNPSLDHVEPEPDPEADLPRGNMQAPAVLARLLLPMAVLVSLFFLLRGHNLPGGGFVGGLIMATAIILQYIVGGVVWVESRQSIRPQKWIALGLLVAGCAALSAWAVSRPFLSALVGDFDLPMIGTVHLSSVLFFDLGVYMLVIGATVLMLVALAHQSLRFRRKVPHAGAAGAATSSSGAS